MGVKRRLERRAMQTKRRPKKKRCCRAGEIWAQVWLQYNIVQSFESEFNSSTYSEKRGREK